MAPCQAAEMVFLTWREGIQIASGHRFWLAKRSLPRCLFGRYGTLPLERGGINCLPIRNALQLNRRPGDGTAQQSLAFTAQDDLTPLSKATGRFTAATSA